MAEAKTDFDVKDFAEHMMSLTRIVVESGVAVMPIAFLIKPGLAVDVLGIAGGVGKDKEKLVADLQAQAVAGNAVVVLIADTWVTDAGGRKGEALVASVFGPGVKPSGAYWRYERDPFRWEQVRWGDVDGIIAPDMRGEKSTQ